MIHAVKDEQVKVAEISRDCEVDDLPATIFQRAVVAGPAAQNQIETAWGRSLGDEVASPRDGVRHLIAYPRQFRAISIGEGRKFLKTTREDACWAPRTCM